MIATVSDGPDTTAGANVANYFFANMVRTTTDFADCMDSTDLNFGPEGVKSVRSVKSVGVFCEVIRLPPCTGNFCDETALGPSGERNGKLSGFSLGTTP